MTNYTMIIIIVMFAEHTSDNYNYHVHTFEAVDEDSFQASIRIALTTPEEAAA